MKVTAGDYLEFVHNPGLVFRLIEPDRTRSDGLDSCWIAVCVQTDNKATSSGKNSRNSGHTNLARAGGVYQPGIKESIWVGPLAGKERWTLLDSFECWVREVRESINVDD